MARNESEMVLTLSERLRAILASAVKPIAGASADVPAEVLIGTSDDHRDAECAARLFFKPPRRDRETGKRFAAQFMVGEPRKSANGKGWLAGSLVRGADGKPAFYLKMEIVPVTTAAKAASKYEYDDSPEARALADMVAKLNAAE